jgi:hypothetical protein
MPLLSALSNLCSTAQPAPPPQQRLRPHLPACILRFNSVQAHVGSSSAGEGVAQRSGAKNVPDSVQLRVDG